MYTSSPKTQHSHGHTHARAHAHTYTHIHNFTYNFCVLMDSLVIWVLSSETLCRQSCHNILETKNMLHLWKLWNAWLNPSQFTSLGDSSETPSIRASPRCLLLFKANRVKNSGLAYFSFRNANRSTDFCLRLHFYCQNKIGISSFFWNISRIVYSSLPKPILSPWIILFFREEEEGNMIRIRKSNRVC